MVILTTVIALLLTAILSLICIIAYNSMSKAQLIKNILIGVPLLILLAIILIFHTQILQIPVLGGILRFVDGFLALFYSYVGGMAVPLYLWIGFIPTIAFIWFTTFAVIEHRKIKANYNKELAEIEAKYRAEDEKKIKQRQNSEAKNKANDNDDVNSETVPDEQPETIEAPDWDLKTIDYNLNKVSTLKKAFSESRQAHLPIYKRVDTGYQAVIADLDGVTKLKQMFSQHNIDLSGIINKAMFVEIDTADEIAVIKPLADYIKQIEE